MMFSTTPGESSWPIPEANDTAYILFTSGTTGSPKAIATQHCAFPHFLGWYVKTFDPLPEDRFSMLSGLSHDPLMRDIFVPLSIGASVCIPKPDFMKLPRRLLQWMGSTGITFAHLTPSLGRLLTRAAQPGVQPMPVLRRAFFGGEPLRFSDVRQFHNVAPNALVVNCYGASETPQIIAYQIIDAPLDEGVDGQVPLNKSIDDVQMLILREDGSMAEDNEAGEICVRTRYLAKGYLGPSTAASERFVANPFNASKDPLDRIYKTGDIGRFLPGLGIEFVGRTDDQIKLRGFRVELGEVEDALRNCPMVSNGAVVVDSSIDDPALYAFVEVASGFDSNECKKRLARILPNYMVPRELFALPTLPHTPNGKLDRAFLLSLVRNPGSSESPECSLHGARR